MAEPMFKRVLLKISGEALAASQGFGIDSPRIHEIAAELADEFTGRDSVDMPAWYRVSVVPSLVRRAAVAALDA